jgi:uncharacterized membrane protein
VGTATGHEPHLDRWSYQFSFGLLLLTLFDVLIVALIWREYRFFEAEPRLGQE